MGNAALMPRPPPKFATYADAVRLGIKNHDKKKSIVRVCSRESCREAPIELYVFAGLSGEPQPAVFIGIAENAKQFIDMGTTKCLMNWFAYNEKLHMVFQACQRENVSITRKYNQYMDVQTLLQA